MGKLYELLAVEEDRSGKCKKIIEETSSTFKNKASHFMEDIIIFKPTAEGEKEVVEGNIQMVTTVAAKMNYTSEVIAEYLDVFAQKEYTNAKAKANVELADGTLFLKDVPATALLGLERELNKMMEMYNLMPTLEPGVNWQSAPDRGTDIYKMVDNRFRTAKVIQPLVLYPHSDKHPAQVKEITKDIVTGVVEKTIHSSKLTPAQKSEILTRLDNLKIAVKKARMRANAEEVVSISLGKQIMDYINKGIKQ